MIAIVIPYYKKRFFRETLNSLANQTDKRFRVFIGDDASPENPEDLIEEYKDRFSLQYKRFENNLGHKSLVKHWERCINLSDDEEWIMILGDDDYYSANLIESFYNHYNEFNSKVNVLRFAKRNIFDQTKEVKDLQYNPKIESAADSFYRRITGQTTSTLSEYAFKREVYNRYGFHDYLLAWHSDNRAWIEFTENKPIYSINDAVVNVVCSALSITGNKDFSNEKRKANLSFYNFLIKKKLYLFNKVQAIRILSKYEIEIKRREKMSFKLYFFLLPYYIKNYRYTDFKKYLKKMIKSLF